MTPHPPLSSSPADTPPEPSQEAIDAIVARGPSGAFAVAAVATAIVVAIYFLFYFVVYLPRGAVQ
jgi:hypothetical protein